MEHWLYPANTKYYDVLGALSRPSTFWPMNSKVAQCDKIFFYLAAPYKQIGFISIVKSVGHPYDEVVPKLRPFFKSNQPEKRPDKSFMKIALESEIDLSKDSKLGLAFLKENGLNGMLMGPRKLDNNPTLLKYVMSQTP